jgi:hypothetical protein
VGNGSLHARPRSVYRVLFFGGDDLTRFQSVALILSGLAVILFVVVPICAYEFGRASEARGLAGPYIAIAMTLWALVMIVNGTVGIYRVSKKNDREVSSRQQRKSE